jgi:hypothetical protein
VPDADLDVSGDLGEAVGRTAGLTSRLKSRSGSPVLPDYLSLVHNPTFVPVIGPQQPGERKALVSLLLCAKRQFLIRMPVYVQPPLPPAPLSIMRRRL